MLFRIILILLAFSFPFIIYFGYICLCEKMQKKHPEKKKLLYIAFLSGLCSVGVLLVYFRFTSGTDDIKDKVFVPATMKDGKIIPLITNKAIAEVSQSY